MLFRYCVVLFFFFKQKTAYEMRISDWSSDVCSSDLPVGDVAEAGDDREDQIEGADVLMVGRAEPTQEETRLVVVMRVRVAAVSHVSFFPCLLRLHGAGGGDRNLVLGARSFRSEEHTSELQSLMRISYAVFCLKKKNANKEYKRYTLTH